MFAHIVCLYVNICVSICVWRHGDDDYGNANRPERKMCFLFGFDKRKEIENSINDNIYFFSLLLLPLLALAVSFFLHECCVRWANSDMIFLVSCESEINFQHVRVWQFHDSFSSSSSCSFLSASSLFANAFVPTIKNVIIKHITNALGTKPLLHTFELGQEKKANILPSSTMAALHFSLWKPKS